MMRRGPSVWAWPLNGPRRSPAAVETARGPLRGHDARGETPLAGPPRPAMTGGVARRFVRAAARWRADLQAAMAALLRVSSVRYSILGLAAVAVLIAAMTRWRRSLSTNGRSGT